MTPLAFAMANKNMAMSPAGMVALRQREYVQAANRGANNQFVTHMNNNVFVHPRDRNGRPLPAVRVPGLVNRRRDEAAPFQTPQGAR